MAATQAVLAGALCAKFPPVTLQHPSSALLDAAASPEAGSPAPLKASIDPEAVARNWRALATRTASACGAVLKADAYGLGVLQIAPSLARAGCSAYFVALPQEGLALRSLLPSATIYVLNGVFEDVREAVAARLVPFVSSMEALAEWPGQAPFALNVDTGMNRLGLAPDEAISVRERRPTLLASHFACADTPSHPLNARQEAAFAALREAFPETPASFANSAALLTRPQAHYDLVRPGIALYGGASAGPATALEPTAKLEARVIQVRHVPAGDPVGYGAAQSVRRPTRLAIASLGYADGYLRAAGGADHDPGALAFVNGTMTRLVGRVSMDLVAVDVTDARCRRGDWIELFGPNVPLDQAAAAAGTIGYELLTGLSRRAERCYGPL